jgi:hypothetical protein
MLGDYYGAALSITAALMDPAIFKLRTAIHFMEVSVDLSSSILAL